MDWKTITNIIIIIIILTINYYIFHYIREKKYIYDYSKFNKVNNIKDTHILPRHKFCIIGAGYSHGEHTLLENGMRFNTIDDTNIIKYNTKNKTISVKSGCIWYDIIKFLIPYNRVPSITQSYYNFSVGGSISVNCHGRNGKSISESIINMKILLSNGTVLICSRHKHYDLFKGVIGGYGLLGIILEATLTTDTNDIIKCVHTKSYQIKQICPEFFSGNNNIVFYNSNIPIMDNSGIITNYYWIKGDYKHLTIKDKIQTPTKWQYISSIIKEQLLRISYLCKYIKDNIPVDGIENTVCYRSYEMASDAELLQPLSKHPNTTTLQEYFIPVDGINKFIEHLRTNLYLINILNISVRYVNGIKDSVINYAPVNSYSIVLYFSVINNELFMGNLHQFTDNMLKYTINNNGKFYLPYLKCYSKELIKQMWNNEFTEMTTLKKKYDPNDMITNEWYKWYKSGVVPTPVAPTLSIFN